MDREESRRDDDDDVDLILKECDILIETNRKLEKSQMILDWVFQNIPSLYPYEYIYQECMQRYSDTYFNSWTFNVGPSLTFFILSNLMKYFILFQALSKIILGNENQMYYKNKFQFQIKWDEKESELVNHGINKKFDEKAIAGGE